MKRKHSPSPEQIDFASLVASKKIRARRQIQVADAAADLVHKHGMEALTYEAIAQKCDLARSLLYHYFPDLKQLLGFSCGLIRYRYQTFVIERMSQKTGAKEIFEEYVLSALEWAALFPRDISVWLLFFHQCAVDPMLADQNTSLVNVGTRRIQSLIGAGIEAGDFHLPPERVASAARQVQLLISAGVVARATERRTAEYWEAEFQQILQCARELVGNAK